MKKTLLLALIPLLAACGQEPPPPPNKPPMPSMNPIQPQADALNKAKTAEGTVDKGAEQRKEEVNRQSGY